MLLVLQITCVFIILIMYKASPVRLVGWYSRSIRCFLENTPFADKQKLFPGASILENNYKRIRAELIDHFPSGLLESSSLINQDLKQNRNQVETEVSAIPLQLFDEWARSKVSRMPYINSLLCELPQVTHAAFRIFRIGDSPPRRVRLFKGVLCYHLPLLSFNNGTSYVVCGSISREHEEGVGILLDETFQHELWSNQDRPQIFLSLDISRDGALPRLVRPFNRILIKLIHRSRRMREAMKLAETKMARRYSKAYHLIESNQS